MALASVPMIPVAKRLPSRARLEGRHAMRWLRSRLRLMPGRSVVAIDVLAGAGKTCFADELAELLSEGGLATMRISLDAYGLSDCYSGPIATVEGAATPSDWFLEDVLEPVRGAGSGRYRTAVADGSGSPRWACVGDRTVVLVDGRYIHGPPFCSSTGDSVWDLSVWLDVPMGLAYQRLHLEQGDRPHRRSAVGHADRSTQVRYLRECGPASRADLVVENWRPHQPID